MNNKQLITLTFDDGWRSQYVNALPILDDFGFKATFYIISGWLEKKSQYAMMADHVVDIHNKGHEIGSHSVSHPSLPFHFWKNEKEEIFASKEALEKLIGAKVKSFAYPYGRYNDKIIRLVQEAGYENARAVNGISNNGFRGFNFNTSFPFEIACKSVKRDTNLGEVRDWIEIAKRNGFWLILNFHQIDEKPYAWGCKPEMLRNICQMVKIYDLAVEPLSKARNLYYQ